MRIVEVHRRRGRAELCRLTKGTRPMHRSLIVAILFLPTTAFAGGRCSPNQHGFFGGDGHSKEAAILICGAKSNKDGVLAEASYAKVHFHGKEHSQILHDRGPRIFDEVTYIRLDKSKVVLFFDITEFFGKGD